MDTSASGWAGALAARLRGRRDGPARFGTGDDAVGLICAVHPDGVTAHLERQRTLHRAGWRLVEAFPSRWSADPNRAAVDLLG